MTIVLPPGSLRATAFAALCAALVGCEFGLSEGRETDARSAAARMGAWSEPRIWPVLPVHLNVLPDGTVLTWGLNGVRNLPGWTDASIWNPGSDTRSQFKENTTNLFCAGHALLPDGRLLVAGGHEDVNVGTANVTVFDPRTRGWSTAATMNAGRWYPSVTVLENGEVLILAGSIDVGRVNPLPQVWTREGRLRDLTGARRNLLAYPWTFVAPNGKVFVAGPNGVTRYLDTEGTGSWTAVAPRVVMDREYGGAVLYDEGRILAIGGGDPPTATAEVIDLRAPSPRWRLTGSLSAPRRHLNATLLADGKVLVTGGTSSPRNDSAGAALEAEIWDPETEEWTVVAGQSDHRLYHSVAGLLPDGRVLTGGGSVSRVETYSPPYLFAADGSPAVRPRITAAPDRVAYGASFLVATPEAAEIERAHLIGLSSSTHALNLQQRLNRLPLARVPGPEGETGLRLRAPASSRLAPPGHYLLFLLNRNGVPSVGRIVWIG